MTICLSKNILVKFENPFTRSVVECELISISNGPDLTNFTKSHEGADTKTLTKLLKVAALPDFVDFSDETILADFQAKAKLHAVKSLDHPLMRLAYHLLS